MDRFCKLLVFSWLLQTVWGASYYYVLTATDDDQWFTSENYPSSYPTDNYYYWRIETASTYKRVRLELVNCYIEYTSGCANDYIRVYDGRTSSEEQLSELCGSCPAVIYTSGNNMYIKFRSDSANVASGFNAKYRQVDQSAEVAIIVGAVFGSLAAVIIAVVLAYIFWQTRCFGKCGTRVKEVRFANEDDDDRELELYHPPELSVLASQQQAYAPDSTPRKVRPQTPPGGIPGSMSPEPPSVPGWNPSQPMGVPMSNITPAAPPPALNNDPAYPPGAPSA